MMLREYFKKLYNGIIQIEVMFFRFYQIDPFTMFDHMTVIELQALIQSIEFQKKEEAKNKQGDKLMKSLVAIRDILNVMTLSEKG